MNNVLKTVMAVSFFTGTEAIAQGFDLVSAGNEVIFDNSIIRVIEFGEDETIGIWLLEDEELVLRDQAGDVIAICDRTLPGDEAFSEFGGSAVNIDGTRVQYAGIDGRSLAGWSVDCLTGDEQVVGGFIPTFTAPDGSYIVGYNGAGTNLYRENGDIEFLSFLDQQVFYYSGNADGSLLGGYQLTPDGDLRGYVNTRGQIGDSRGVAVVRETPFGDTIILGQIVNQDEISMDYITDDEWNTVEAGWVMGDANPDGFLLNQYSIGEGEFGEDVLGHGCVISDDPAVLEGITGAAGNEFIDNWCQSFVRQDDTYYIATGDSWQNTFKLQIFTVRAQEPAETEVTDEEILAPELVEIENSDEDVAVASPGECFDSPPLNDGFGWNGVATCLIDTSYTSEQVLVAGDCIDTFPIGDGFGWDGENSCVVNEDNATGTATLASSGSCFDTVPLNDGFGWDGVASCIIEGPVISATGACIDTLPIGDGFGWDGVGTCTIETNAVIATNGECIDVSPFDDNYGFDGINGCFIGDVNQDAAFNGCIDSPPVGDGFGWDGSATCLIE